MRLVYFPHFSDPYVISSMQDDDFEVVPQDDQDVEMWDVSNENEDALKQAHIQSLFDPV